MRPRLFGSVCFVLHFLLGASSSFSPSSVVRGVAVIGGTHGNEYTGVWCIKALELQAAELKEKYPTLEISSILANPDAHLANKRFIDTDLNREFSFEKLCSLDDSEDDEAYEADNTVEGARARELNKLLGSKCNGDDTNTYDVAIDLHSTTSNMGMTLIINEGDPLMALGAAYVAHKCPDAKCLMHSIPDRGNRPNLSSTTTHGFTIEVGPVPQGLLRHDAVLKTECALHALLEFLQRSNAGEDILSELRAVYPTGAMSAYKTAPAQRPGEMSGKISWPSDPDNPNFPTLMIHQSLQDRDYEILRKGDPIFVALNGSTVYYDGAYGDEVSVMFVNEGGYYYQSSGTGISVAVQVQFDIQTGMIQQEDEVPKAESRKESSRVEL